MDKVEELRVKLKNERQSRDTGTSEDTRNNIEFDAINTEATSSTGSDIVRHSPDSSAKNERNERPIQGLRNSVRGIVGTIDNTKRKPVSSTRSTSQNNIRERSATNGHGNNNGAHWTDGNNIQTGDSRSSEKPIKRIGNLETDESIPERYFQQERVSTTKEAEVERDTVARQRGRPPKQRISEPIQNKPKKQIFKGTTLSKAEAEDIKEPLMSALKDEFEMIDGVIWNYSKDALKQPVWSDMTEKELETISNIILRMSQRSPVAASFARTATVGGDYIAAGTILLPRFQSTVGIIQETRKKIKDDKGKSRRERLRNI